MAKIGGFLFSDGTFFNSVIDIPELQLMAGEDASFYLPGLANQKAYDLGLQISSDKLVYFKGGGFVDHHDNIIINKLVKNPEIIGVTVTDTSALAYSTTPQNVHPPPQPQLPSSQKPQMPQQQQQVQAVGDQQMPESSQSQDDQLEVKTKATTSTTASSQDDLRINWHDKATRMLIDEFVKMRSQFEDPSIKKNTLWKQVMVKLHEAGYRATVTSCDKKWRQLKERYREMRLMDSSNKHVVRNQWPFYDVMHEVLGSDPPGPPKLKPKFRSTRRPKNNRFIYHEWTHEEILVLIEEHGKRLLEFENSPNATQGEVWNLVAAALQAQGFKPTGQDCRAKWCGLKHRYQKLIYGVAAGEWKRISWQYYGPMDQQLSHLRKDICMDNVIITNKSTHSPWPHKAILILLEEYKKEKAQLDQDALEDKQFWKPIGDALTAQGFAKFAPVCCKKMNNLKIRYKRLRCICESSDYCASKWEYYDMLDEIMANDPPSKPEEPVPALGDDMSELTRKTIWGYKAILQLIEVAGQRRPMYAVIGTRRAEWQLVSAILLSHGFNYTAEECEKKWKGLKHTYKRIRIALNEKGEHHCNHWGFYDAMHQHLGKDPRLCNELGLLQKHPPPQEKPVNVQPRPPPTRKRKTTGSQTRPNPITKGITLLPFHKNYRTTTALKNKRLIISQGKVTSQKLDKDLPAGSGQENEHKTPSRRKRKTETSVRKRRKVETPVRKKRKMMNAQFWLSDYLQLQNKLMDEIHDAVAKQDEILNEALLGI